MNTELSDDRELELLARIAGRDRQAFAEFYDRQCAFLYSLILAILSDPAEAQDVLQDTFLQIWDKAAMFDPSLGRPLSWTVALARNKALDRLRSLRRRQELLKSATEQFAADAAVAKPDLGAQDTARLIQSHVKELPCEQRQAIEMAFFGGLTQNEIAEVLHVPLGTVKARIRRGMLRLRDALEAYL